LNNIVLNKNLPLYWYTIDSPLEVDFCSVTGYLFVRALCTKCDKTVVLVY
jgi:hypothetical protein